MIYEWQVHEKKKGETEFVDITNSIRNKVSTNMDIDKNFVSLPHCFTPGKTDFSKEKFFKTKLIVVSTEILSLNFEQNLCFQTVNQSLAIRNKISCFAYAYLEPC